MYIVSQSRSGGAFAAWKLKSEAARRGRAFGYQLDSDSAGRMNGTTNAGFRGWPATQRDSETIYIRFWHYQRYFDTDIFSFAPDADHTLVDDLPTGATSATVVKGISYIGNTVSGLEEFYITLDNGELHYCQQVEPVPNNETFNFTPGLPSPASAGNRIYVRRDSTLKLLRIYDGDKGTGENRNCWYQTGFRSSMSNDKFSREPGHNRSRS